MVYQRTELFLDLFTLFDITPSNQSIFLVSQKTYLQFLLTLLLKATFSPWDEHTGLLMN